MTSLLGYTYSTKLTDQEKAEINARTQKSREEFSRGFLKGSRFSLAAYSLYSVTAAASAYAADSGPKTGAIQPTGFKPTRGAFVGGSSAICGAALQSGESGDFLLGLGFAFIIVLGAIIINRSPEK